MSSRESPAWLRRWRTRLTPVPPEPARDRHDGRADAHLPSDPAQWLCLEDTTSRWLRTTQGAELG